MVPSTRQRLSPLFAVIAITMAACGDDADEGTGSGGGTTGTESTSAATSPATGSGSGTQAGPDTTQGSNVGPGGGGTGGEGQGGAGAGGEGQGGELSDLTKCEGATYFIGPDGSDEAGDGSEAAPWRSLAFATASVLEAGSTIHAFPGTYVESETSVLATGVCIEGEGSGTVITSTLTGDFQPIILADSPEGTDGHQHISGLVLDGNALATWWGIYVGGRSNVSIHDCTIVDFLDRGVIFNGQEDLANLDPPAIYATGNSFHDNLLENSSRFTEFGTGCLNIGSQEGMIVSGNTITQLDRPQGENGWPIKYTGDGWLRGVRIFDNVITKIPFGGQYNGDGGWDFAIELFHVFGLEIHDNEIQGSIDLNWQWQDDAYPHSAWIHDNVVGQPVLNDHPESGIILEFDSTGVLIENNVIRNVLIGVSFTPRANDAIDDITIRGNVFAELGLAGAGHGLSGGLLGVFPEAGAAYSIERFTLQNNTMVASPDDNPHWGVQIENGPSSVDRVTIQNNIAMGFESGWLVTSFPITNLVVSHNDAFGNGGGDDVVFTGDAPPGAVIGSNISADPQFVPGGSYALQAGSPAVDAGVDVGLPFLGDAPDLGAVESF